MNGYYIYVIKSKVDKRLYVGMSKDPVKRVKSHNNGDTKSTKGYRPWILVFQKYIGSRIEARKVEKKYKSGYMKELLKLNIPL